MVSKSLGKESTYVSGHIRRTLAMTSPIVRRILGRCCIASFHGTVERLIRILILDLDAVGIPQGRCNFERRIAGLEWLPSHDLDDFILGLILLRRLEVFIA